MDRIKCSAHDWTDPGECPYCKIIELRDSVEPALRELNNWRSVWSEIKKRYKPYLQDENKPLAVATFVALVVERGQVLARAAHEMEISILRGDKEISPALHNAVMAVNQRIDDEEELARQVLRTMEAEAELAGARAALDRERDRCENLENAARALLTRKDFWDHVPIKPGEYDDLKESVER